MTGKKKVVKKLEGLVEKSVDAKTRRRVKAEVFRRLKQGKAALARLQKELAKPENRAKISAQLERARAALRMLKGEAKRRGRQAVAYSKKNPEKALAAAVMAGAAAGALLLVLRKRR